MCISYPQLTFVALCPHFNVGKTTKCGKLSFSLLFFNLLSLLVLIYHIKLYFNCFSID
uniref:Uncharacterized protein n=1 Tax=Rhizophora mucronata TaxID=61149 RepID=A0A2P2JBL3_RHIMU